MLNSLDHPHIVKFKKLHESDNKLFIAMELLSGGSLHDLIYKMKNKG